MFFKVDVAWMRINWKSAEMRGYGSENSTTINPIRFLARVAVEPASYIYISNGRGMDAITTKISENAGFWLVKLYQY